MDAFHRGGETSTPAEFLLIGTIGGVSARLNGCWLLLLLLLLLLRLLLLLLLLSVNLLYTAVFR